MCAGRGCEHHSQLSPSRSDNDTSYETFFSPYAYVNSPQTQTKTTEVDDALLIVTPL